MESFSLSCLRPAVKPNFFAGELSRICRKEFYLQVEFWFVFHFDLFLLSFGYFSEGFFSVSFLHFCKTVQLKSSFHFSLVNRLS